MTVNFGYAGTCNGVIKIVHILFGLISSACAIASFNNEYFRERFLVGVVISFFIGSLLYFLVHLASEEVTYHNINRILGVAYHFIGAGLLIVAASLFLELVVTDNGHCRPPAGFDRSRELCSKFDTKISAGSFALINGVLYLVATVLTGISSSGVDDGDDVYKS